ncbi:hypothetical protein bcgnr5378_29020 [Bacillus cereus]|nr:hypothetical protein [Bacillus cereus]HDR8330197.1 hypothetical protein [Bacillus cereus]HDR8335849.1 hypothetical protein [Bacillus cereus]
MMKVNNIETKTFDAAKSKGFMKVPPYGITNTKPYRITNNRDIRNPESSIRGYRRFYQDEKAWKKIRELGQKPISKKKDKVTIITKLIDFIKSNIK